jgi:hypothetical protein
MGRKTRPDTNGGIDIFTEDIYKSFAKLFKTKKADKNLRQMAKNEQDGKHYSYLSASIGSRREALLAGQ